MSKSGYPAIYHAVALRRESHEMARRLYYGFVLLCVLIPMFTFSFLFKGEFAIFFTFLIFLPLSLWMLYRNLFRYVMRVRKDYEIACPSCQSSFPISMPWRCVCGHEHERLGTAYGVGISDILKDEYPHFLHGCGKCSRAPSAINCPHCGTVLLLTKAAEDWDEDMVHKNCVMVGLDTEWAYSPAVSGGRDPAADIRAHLDEK